MRGETLAALVEAVGSHVPVVLATRTDTGEQALLYPLADEAPATKDAWPREEAAAALLADRACTVEATDGVVFLRPYNPPVRVVVVGAVHVAQALVPLVSAAGYEPVLIDPRSAFATETRFPGVRMIRSWPEEGLAELGPDHRTAIVALTHDPKLDDPAIRFALASPAFYVGALGSRRTHEKRVTRLLEYGVEREAVDRISAPIGLSIGARTPEEIAVSIIAEIVSALRVPAQA